MINTIDNIQFETITEWTEGFTGALKFQNAGESLSNWTIEFEAPFEIKNNEIWGAEIISRQGDRYTIRPTGHNEIVNTNESVIISFNANKINGTVSNPKNIDINLKPLNMLTTQNTVTTTNQSNNVDFNFQVNTEWQQGFTGQIEVVNQGENLKDWTFEFEVPFNISNDAIWGGTIISQSGNKYVIRPDNHNLFHSQQSTFITFNADKVDGTVGEPTNFNLGSESNTISDPISLIPASNAKPQTTDSDSVFDFKVSAEWEQGFTGKLEFTNTGNSLNGWTVEFEAPFEISDIWDAEIVSQSGNKYVIRSLDYNGEVDSNESVVVTFNANKIGNEIIEPQGMNLESGVDSISPEPTTNNLNNNNNEITTDYKVSDEWEEGFTGKLEFTNANKTLGGWSVEFEAPFEITDIWDAEIISRSGNKYVIGNLDYNEDVDPNESVVVTFNANKVNGEINPPQQISVYEESSGQLGDGDSGNSVTTNSGTNNSSSSGNNNTIEDNNSGSNNNSGQFNYGEATQKSLLFYEAQRSGALPDDNRIAWRGDSGLEDGSDVGRDLTGGYHDAGDHVKFGQPMGMSVATLAWGGIEYKEAYEQMGQWDELKDAVKWGTDFFLKSHVTEGGKTKELYIQVGDGELDHSYWGSPEDMTMERPAFKIDEQNPGTDVASDYVAALASASMVFRGEDDAYADRLINEAKQIYEFAENNLAKYSDSVDAANPYYTSWGGYGDELVWGAAWLHKATGEKKYLDKAKNYADEFGISDVDNPGDWTLAADEKKYGAMVLLAQTGDESFQRITESWLDNWINGGGEIQYSEGGFASRAPWGSLALSTTTAFLAEVYNDTVNSDPKYQQFATQQIDYALGDNPANFSYMVGFGNNYAQQPHHRAASGMDSSLSRDPNNNIIFGALVGGPQSADDFDYNDDRNDYITNEVAISYNAGLTGALAAMYDNYGGDPLTDEELNLLPGIEVEGF